MPQQIINPIPQQSTSSIQSEPSLLERWSGVEEWIQNSGDEEFRTMYNTAEVGEAKIISASELYEFKRRAGIKDDE